MIVETGDAKLLAMIRESEAEKVPKGWYTRKEWQKRWNLREARTRELLARAIEEGLMERKEFVIKSDVYVMRIPHYKAV